MRSLTSTRMSLPEPQDICNYRVSGAQISGSQNCLLDPTRAPEITNFSGCVEYRAWKRNLLRSSEPIHDPGCPSDSVQLKVFVTSGPQKSMVSRFLGPRNVLGRCFGGPDHARPEITLQYYLDVMMREV